MCPIATTGADAGHDFMAEKRRKRQAILDNNLINVWQKKHLLDALDKEYAKYETATPAKPVVPVAKTNTGGKPKVNPANKKKAPTPTPSPTKGPVAGPAPKPEETPPPEPKEDTTKPAPRPVQARKPYYTDDTIEAYKPPVAAPAIPKPVQTGAYEAARKALDATFMPKQSQIKLGRELDEQYGTNEKAAQNQKFIDDNRAKLQAQTDEINRIKARLRDLGRYRYEDWDSGAKEAGALTKQLDEKIRGFGNVTGLSGGVIDPTRVVDIKLDGKNVGNARYVDGRATGDLDDVVKGLGGDVVWDKLKSGATIYDPDGNIVSYLTKAGNKIIEKDTKGNIIKRYSTEDGKAQADIEGFAGRFDVPYSYYHDKNGVYRAYSQPEMRGAPITVVRKEGDVYIEANIDFEGKYADQIYPGTEKKDPATGKAIPGSGMTYAEVTAQGIINKWGNGQTFNVGGQMTVKDSKGKEIVDKDGFPLGAYYLNPNDTVKTHVAIYSDSESKNNIMSKPQSGNSKKNKVFIRDPLLLEKLLNFRSHVFTADDVLEGVAELPKNIGDMLNSGQIERTMYNWSMQDPGTAYIYPEADVTTQMLTGAHESTHTFGIGDAYFDKLFRPKEAPKAIDGINIYGQKTRDVVPANDMARGGDTVSDIDITMLLRSFETGNPQYFPKDNDDITREIQKDGIKAIIKYIKDGTIRFK